jgi:plasmid replication initiation protein
MLKQKKYSLCYMSDLIVKDNALMNASYNLDLVEQRLILLAILEARESGKGINANDPLTVHAESYINQFGVHRTTAYQALKDACKDLFARQFSYQEKRERGRANITSRWVSQIAYIDETATVEVIFAPAVVPLITRLEEQFTQYDIEQISGLSSAYAVRMYELLISWRTTGKTPIIELGEFRKRIGVLDTEYQRIERLKHSVLELALKQINEHTDITASYEQHKKGRVITGFSFKFKQKKNSDKTPKEGDSSPRIEKPSQIPTSIVKQPETAKKDDLGYRASKITGLIMSNGLADRFKRGDESVMDMMKRIKEEITTDVTADQWENKLEEFGVIF